MVSNIHEIDVQVCVCSGNSIQASTESIISLSLNIYMLQKDSYSK